ncbi:MAG TPA: ribokinase [Terriglobales bacterium]|nr:ribokinase [Terriglobales bacterium]
MQRNGIVVMGSFVADLAFRTPRLPAWGETVLGSEFRLGPGGKGSNQAVCIARLGMQVSFLSKLGRDAFGDLARRTYKEEGVNTQVLYESAEHSTGGASIVVHEGKGENAIVVVPGASFQLTKEEVEKARPLIAGSSAFVTQLELPLAIVEHGLKLAHEEETPAIFNPAPALPIPGSIYPLCNYATPNESEAAALTGLPQDGIAAAERAADELLRRGVRNVVVTLGAQGALVKNASVREHVPAVDAGAVVETTGAGDAFNGGFAVALAEGADLVEAARFACVVAGISVTRPGTAPSMPKREEVERLHTRPAARSKT